MQVPLRSQIGASLAVAMAGLIALATSWCGAQAQSSNQEDRAGRSALTVPIGPPISTSVLTSQDLRFKELRPGRRAISDARAIQISSNLLFEPARVPSAAYIVAARFGRISRTRSPITNYDNHLVWVVEIIGGGSPKQDSTGAKALAMYVVLDALTGARFFEFRAPIQ